MVQCGDFCFQPSSDLFFTHCQITVEFRRASPELTK